MGSRYIVRFGNTRNLGEFVAKGRDNYARSEEVVVRSDRGLEIGTVLCPASERTKEYLGTRDAPGQIVRSLTDEDQLQRTELHRQESDEFQFCRRLIEERQVQMQLVDAERLFGGERLIFYYVAEQRVDFRELVKVLAKQFRTRIEMRQIGVRDEAKLLADYGDCGKPTCCNTHLTEMPPVSMKMAKLQKATLDPSKISGRCGRLKCCLRYEYDTYEEIRRELPGVGSMVLTRQGQGRVVSQEILARKLMIHYDDHRQLAVEAAEIITVISSKGQRHDQN